MEDENLEVSTSADEDDVGREVDDGEARTLLDSEGFDNPVTGAVGNPIGTEEIEVPAVAEAGEQPVVTEGMEGLVLVEMIQQPIVLESDVVVSAEFVEGDDSVALAHEIENEMEEVKNEIDGVKGENVVCDEFPESTDGTQLVAGALEHEVENELEDVKNGIDDSKCENAVGDEFPEPTDGIQLVEDAIGASFDEKVEEQDLFERQPEIEAGDNGTAAEDCLSNMQSEHKEEFLIVDESERKTERDICDTGNIVEMGGDGVIADISNAGIIVGVVNECDGTVDHSLNSEVGSLQNQTVFYEETSDPESAAKVTVSSTDEDTGAATEQIQAHNLSGDMKYASGDTETAGDELMTEVEVLESRTKTLDDHKNNIEEFKVSILDSNMNAVETNEEAGDREGLPSGNTKTETDAGVELETMGSDTFERIQLADAGMETGLGKMEDMQDEDVKMETEGTSSDVDEPGQSMHDSPAALRDEDEEAMTGDEETGTQDAEMETETDAFESGKTAGVKRKRGKPSKITSSSRSTGKNSRKKIREDVCFICFEEGELVVCGRRGCPKAYHPSCVNRDEAFFRSKGRWTCGWHLCSICEKNAHYMCYTCAYSLCKSCAKDSVIFCVRGNKGFCETCMRTVNLIEGNQQGSDTEVDFDDRSSLEYLFKDYYTELKAKLSLSSAEIAEAQNQFKGAEISTCNIEDIDYGDSGSEDSTVNVEPVKSKVRKLGKNQKAGTKEEGVHPRDTSLYENADWASKELLEFVSHMKDGDVSVLSQFDVQALLLEYIKRNKLRDPRRGSQILCDARLKSLFGKPRVGHFEMLKLIESHFLLKDEQNDDVQSSVVDTDNLQLETDGNTDAMQKGGKDKKRKSCKKGDKPQSNLDDYAAIDMHNIGLIYLRRKLMEDLLEDAATFPDKVIGTFVRIRIFGSNQKQDLYRLVQVVGTSKSPEPYKIGKKATDIMVDILNLDKTETISIDTISNQDFTEEECKRLRQSIKCGLINPLTVGVILAKTMELQMIRVNDLLESEILRISHLCDRASDLGRRKEHRECVEKLQLLKTPEERRRRLEESPEIHADPKMDPNYESEDDDSETEDIRQEAFMRSNGSDMSKRDRSFISPRSDNSTKDSYNLGSQASSRNMESGRSVSRNIYTDSRPNPEMVYEKSSSFGRDKETIQFDSLGKVNSAITSEAPELAVRPRSGSVSVAASVASEASNSPGSAEKSVKINESGKIWHYLDPSGKVQGPFSLVQLRKWNNTGYFPADLRIWRATESQENSVFLTDALAGKLPRELPLPDNSFSATNSLSRSHSMVDHSVRSTDPSLNQDKERLSVDRVALSSLSDLSGDTLSRNGTGSLGFTAARQSNIGSGSPLAGAIISAAASVLQQSTPVVPNVGIQYPNPASVTTVSQAAAFTPPSSQPVIIAGNSAASLPTQSIPVSEPLAVQTPVQPATASQPVQNVITQNPHPDNQGLGAGGPQSVQPQPQGYSWGAPNASGGFQNLGPSEMQPDASGRPIQGSQQQAVPPGSTPNSSWNMGHQGNTMGLRPENDNAGWGPTQTNPNMGWMNPGSGNANVNWPAQGGNQPTSWPAPPPGPGGNTGGNMQGYMPGNPNAGWGPNQGWSNPSPGQMPAWGPPPGNATGAPPPPPPVQGPPPHGNANQGWAPQGSWTGDRSQGPPPAPPSGNANQGWAPIGQGSWTGGDRNQGPPPNQGWGPPSCGSQVGSWGGDQRGGRPWNRQSSFGGGAGAGGSRYKRDTVCPYNANGRCKKGARCDYMHV